MMKLFRYLFVSMLVLLSFVITVGAANDKAVVPREPVALFIQLDPTGVAKPLDMTKEIYKSVEKKLAKADKAPISFEKAQKDFKTYLRDNDTSVNQREQDMGAILRTKDLKNLATKESTRYVIVVSSRVTSSEEKDNFWTGKRKNLTILTNVIIYDAMNGEYLVDDEFQSVGTTSGSYERAYNRAIKDMLDQVDFVTHLH